MKPTNLKGTQVFKTGHDDVNIETLIGRYQGGQAARPGTEFL